MRKFLLSSVLLLIVCIASFDAPKDIFRTLFEFSREIHYAGVGNLKNKINFFTYFTEHIGSMRDVAGVYLPPEGVGNKSCENLFTCLHNGHYKKLVSTLIERENLSDEQRLILESSCSILALANKRSADCDTYFQQKSGLSASSRYFRQLYAAVTNLPLKKTSPALLTRFLPDKISDRLFLAPRFLDKNMSGKGLAVEDFNGDGFVDIIAADSYGSVRFFSNKKGKGFEQRSVDAFEFVTQVYSVIALDYNNDGWMDVFFGRPFHHYQLFENQQGESFKNVSQKLGSFNVKNNFYGTWHVSLGDVDSDGDIDLFVSNWGETVPFASGVLAKEHMSSLWLINQGAERDFHFERRGESMFKALPLRNRLYVASALTDVNNDFSLEFLISDFTRIGLRLFTRTHDRFYSTSHSFDAAPGYLLHTFDVNADGLLDVIRGGNGQFKSIVERLAAEGESVDSSSRVFVQDAESFFTDKNFFDIPTTFTALGYADGDFNNDGCRDFVFATGNPEPWFIAPNLFYLGTSDTSGCKASLSQAAMFGSSKQEIFSKLQGVVAADINNDGNTDIVASCGGFWPGEACGLKYYENKQGLHTSWLSLRLRGTQSNYFGVGANVFVETLSKDNVRQKQVFTMNNQTGFGSSPYEIHVGFGDSVLRKVSVMWPVSKKIVEYALTEGKRYTLFEDGKVEDGSMPGKENINEYHT